MTVLFGLTSGLGPDLATTFGLGIRAWLDLAHYLGLVSGLGRTIPLDADGSPVGCESHLTDLPQRLNGAKGVELNVTELERLLWPGYEIA